ncbi:Transposase DDE domain-containing protein, partial [Acidaminococcus fermentans]|uniref:IS4 family transposase n=1 Tax=Acidaminococcus fermentans TaxID=905 RepID=UPI0008E46BAF
SLVAYYYGNPLRYEVGHFFPALWVNYSPALTYDVLNKQYIDCIDGPKNGYGGNERGAAVTLIKKYSHKNTITIMDRGYISYNLIEHGNRSGGYYMVRSNTTGGTIKEIGDLPNEPVDKWVAIKVTTAQKKKYLDNGYRLIQIIKKHYKNKSVLKDFALRNMKRQWDHEEACEIRFRIVKFRINDSGKNQWEVIVTNLPSNRFSVNDIKNLYAMRWGIETSFRSLKYAVGAIQFHSKQDEFVRQELYAHLVMYNIVSACGNCVELPEKSTKHEYALDFKMAVTIVRSFFRQNIESFFRLCEEMSKYTQPVRQGRKDLRKLRPKSPIYFIYRVA